MNQDQNEMEITQILLGTDRGGMEELIRSMKMSGFFKAPCSLAHHLACYGGLAEHSLNVYKKMLELNEALGANLDETSIAICALLHDLGKAGDHGKDNYVPNMVRSKTKNKETGLYDYVQSEAKPFTINPDLLYEEHEIRSVLKAERCIFLTEEEESAILHHNGLFSKLDSSFGNHNFDKTPLAFILHTADMWCSRFLESEGEE